MQSPCVSTLPAIAPTRAGPAQGLTWARPLLARRELVIGAALLVFWAFCNPFHAIDASSLIYSARAFADLDPAGVGRDMMFVHDGQSGFTLFTFIMRALAGVLGLAPTTMLFAAAAVIASFGAAFVLASAIARGPTRNLIVAFAATLPAQYGGYKLFAYAEVAATPRPFAEALVLCGLAALVSRKPLAATLLMAGAAVLHPIMAASGVAVLVLWLILEDRRWLAVVGALGAASVALAFVGVHPFDRLTAVIDPQWAAILKDRNPHLFPSSWPGGWMGRSATRIATLLIAARLVPPPTRRLFLLVLLVGLCGFAAAYLLNERVGALLVLQAQTWRMMWLVFALATAGAAICTVELWARGGTARLALAFLALAWVYADYDLAAAMFAVVAVGTVTAIDPKKYAAYDKAIGWTVAVLGAWAIYGLARTELDILSVSSNAPASMIGDARRTIALGFDYTPLAVAAAIWAVHGRAWRLGPVGLGLAVAVGTLAVCGVWDQRSAANIYFDSDAGAPDLVRLITSKPGEVYWIDGGRKVWWWLHRPQWISPIQGAGIVFSRELALLYKARAERTIAAGLADPAVMTPLTSPQAAAPVKITKAAVTSFCAAPDAPAWIIAPLVAGAEPADGVVWSEWTAPVAEMEPVVSDGADVWRQVSRYAVIPCAR